MIEDPKRLCDEGGDELERELLASMRRAGAPDGARDAAWRGIAAQLTVGVAAGAGAAAASSAAAAKAGAGAVLPGAIASKAVLVIAAGGVAVGGYFAAQHAFDRPAAPTPERPRPVLSAPAPARLVQTAAETAEPSEAAVPAETPQARPVARASEAKRSAALAAESALLAETRSRLRAGDTRGAQAALARSQARFPHGQLGQERNVLAIELLAAQGNSQGAARRARAFIAAHPGSPHSAALARFLDQP